MKHNTADIPTEACRFSAPIQFQSGATPAEPRRITGIAYSGDVLAHPYWEAVIFDLATTTAPDRLPVLVEHDRSQRAGVARLRILPARIEVESGTLLRNATGDQVAADADAGFPWQLSVHIEPREVQRLSVGESVVVNGRKVEGPANVFRHSLIREVSLTPTGVDSNTSATVFSAGAARNYIAKAAPVDPSEFARAIRAEQFKASLQGESITVLDAVSRLRAAAA